MRMKVKTSWKQTEPTQTESDASPTASKTVQLKAQL